MSKNLLLLLKNYHAEWYLYRLRINAYKTFIWLCENYNTLVSNAFFVSLSPKSIATKRI